MTLEGVVASTATKMALKAAGYCDDSKGGFDSAQERARACGGARTFATASTKAQSGIVSRLMQLGR